MRAGMIERLESLASIIENICSIGGVPGLSLGVAHQGQIIHTANFGYQDVERKIPPDADTLYGTASISKIFTASAVGALVDAGKLSWKTSIAEVFPELNSPPSGFGEDLTIMDLLTHRTGVSKSNYWWFGAEGVLLLPKDDTLSVFKALRKTKPFRSGYDYNNWNYALVGEVIEKISGMSYGKYIQEHILDPLNLSRTTTTQSYSTSPNFARPYATLDDGSFFPVAPPSIHDGEIMVGAQGVQSSVNDLLKFCSSLLEAQAGKPSPLKQAAKQLSGHIFRANTLMEKSYGLGLMRLILPNTIGGGCNSQFVKLPTILSGSDTRLVVYHAGSQAGYTSFVTMLPEIDTSFVVLTNSVGLADPCGWVNELLVELLVDSPNRTDFVQLASQAAKGQISKFPNMERSLAEKRLPNTSPKPLEEYIGRYVDTAHKFLVEIRLKGSKNLQVAFQGLDSQAWNLRHYEKDTFLWLTSRDEQARRARFTYSPASVYKIIFVTDSRDEVVALLWPHDPSIPESKQRFEKVDKELGDHNASQRPVRMSL